MQQKNQTDFDEVLIEAAEWYVQCKEGLSDTEQDEFTRWKASCIQHTKAWKEITATWGALNNIAEHPNARVILEHCEKEEKQQRRRWQTGSVAILALCLFLPLMWSIQNNYEVTYWTSDYRTFKGEIENLTLEDGSQLTMNTTTSIDVDFSTNERRITLKQGEFFIDVALDPKRPLIIVTEAGTARALGTRFTVERIPQKGSSDTAMRVAVYESRVRVCASQINKCKDITEHREIEMTSHQMSTVATIKPSEPTWLRKQLSVRDEPLVEVLNELARYHQGVLYFDPNELDHLRISGTLPLDDIPHALDALALTLPIEAKPYTDWFLVLSLKKE